ncbi:hypothetical protein [Pseudomonas sp. 17033095]|uniref:hypothetical protein n=1 Tax=Pseudomonas sp. 17033095 TaxID=2952231 RepID=UPI002158164D|nr:hypothetical protein [Pseudomonas sp. 17033095]HEJ5892299.1 hypothetical protein [Pseudomonas aeruginosa]
MSKELNKALDLLHGLVREVERKTCCHEETHRGGAIWEICDSCGAKWADDEGGKPEFAWPESVEKAREFLATHPAVEQAGGDERDFQAKGAQEVPSPVSKEYDRHLIGLLRKGEALPGHQEEAADEIERLRDWNDHLNNTVLPNILNPNFLMLMKGGERLLDLCTKDGEFIGVSLNDMKDVFDWMVTHARIAPDQAALAQPSPAQTQPSPAPTLRAAIDVANDRFEVPVAKWGTDLVGEEERPEVAEVAFVLRNIGAMDAEDIDGDNVDLRFEDAEGRDTGCDVSIVEYAEKAADLFEQHDRIVGELRADRDSWAEQAEQRLADWDEMRKERDAALAEVVRLTGVCASLDSEKREMEHKRDAIIAMRDAALARVAELEKQEPVATIAKVPGEDWNGLHFYRDLQGMQPGTKLYAAPVAQAQPEETPGEILAAKLIETWVAKHGKPAPWSKIVEITALATNMPNDERDRLLALDDDVDAQAQHSVPEGWMLVECGIWTQEQVDEMQKTVARFRNSEFVDDRALAMAVADAGQCKAPEISLAELLAAAPGKEGV